MKKRILSSLCALAVILGSSSVASAKVKTKTAVTVKKKASKKKAIVLYADSTIKKTKKLKVKNAKWSTSNKKVATVKNGKITAKKKGKAVIKAKTKKKTQRWNVTVKKVSINKTKLSLFVGKSKMLKLNGEKIKSVKTSSKKIVTINKKGKVKAIKKGSCVITLKGKNKKSYKCKVTVLKVQNSTDAENDKEEEEKKEKEKTVAEKAAEYSYTIEPVLAPFCRYYLVTTDNPDVTKIRFTGTSTTGDEVALQYDEREYADISYYDEATKQVKKDTYIFMLGKKDKPNIYAYNNPVSGNLTLEATSQPYTPSTYSYFGSFVSITSDQRRFEKSDKQFTLPEGLESVTDYLIHTYADPVNGSFFDKMDAVQNGLDKLAVYPKNPVDRSGRAKKYPALCASPYQELGLNMHADIYPRASKEIFTEYIYPYLLDSLGFPSTMSSVAKKLDSSCTVTRGSNHWEIKVTLNGTDKIYGGAGTGSANTLYIDLVGKDYRFDGTDLLSGGISAMRTKYLEYAAASDKAQDELKTPLTSAEVGKVISQRNNTGEWLRIGVEGTSGIAYEFAITGYTSPTSQSGYASYMSDCWADGRYIGKHEAWEKGAHFSDHPTANILLTNQTYKTSKGEDVKGNRLYRYLSASDIWIDSTYYYAALRYPSNYTAEALDKKNISYLTKDDVSKLNVDENTDTTPSSGYIYDGSAQPGTPFGA